MIPLAYALFIFAMGAYLLRDSRRQKVPKDYYSLIGKNGVIVNLLVSEDANFHFYHVRIAGEIWKAKSQDVHKLGDTCVIKAQSKDLTLDI